MISMTALALAASLAFGQAGDYAGPIPVQNHHPLYVGLLYPVPEEAAPAGSFKWTIAANHTNVYMFDSGGEWNAALDMELTEADISASLPIIPGKLEAGFSAPLYHSYEGFMDTTIRWWHHRLGAASYAGEDQAPDNRYVDTIYHDGQLFTSGKTGWGAGDASFWLKAKLWEDQGAVLSAQGLAQAPTGDADRGFGSGQWEGALRLLGEFRHEIMAGSMGIGAASPGSLKRFGQSVALDPVYFGFAGLEIPVVKRLNLVVQSMANTSPLKDAGIVEYSREWVEITFGFNYILESGSVIRLGFSENLNQTAPDFTVHLSFTGMTLN
ncbi:MAG: DUF3187 family protein [Nitrospinae bacterium]|nr:DUF3187 family protein [Nitrospinota bacterium]